MLFEGVRGFLYRTPHPPLTRSPFSHRRRLFGGSKPPPYHNYSFLVNGPSRTPVPTKRVVGAPTPTTRPTPQSLFFYYNELRLSQKCESLVFYKYYSFLPILKIRFKSGTKNLGDFTTTIFIKKIPLAVFTT